MHFTGEIYRPPLERFNPLLEVTAGCSYNQCAFCDMYHLPFRVSPIEDVQVDIDEIRAARPRGVKRVWLVNGDPFALSADRLAEIARRARATIAELESISCHASIRNLLKFSIDDLKRLRSLGFTDLYIGIESGDDVALELIRKGCTAAQQREVLGRLREAGIGYHALLMLGVAGHGNGERNARATAELLNEFPPLTMNPTPLVIRPSSELARLRDAGEFVEVSEGEAIEEEKTLISLITASIKFLGMQIYNLIPVRGELPRDREKLINFLNAALSRHELAELERPVRRKTTL